VGKRKLRMWKSGKLPTEVIPLNLLLLSPVKKFNYRTKIDSMLFLVRGKILGFLSAMISEILLCDSVKMLRNLARKLTKVLVDIF